MLNNWDGQIKLKKDYVSVLEKYCDELIEAIGASDDCEQHFLLRTREKTHWDDYRFRRKGIKELEKEAYGDFVDAIYSNDFEQFLQHFFGNLVLRRYPSSLDMWDVWLNDFDDGLDTQNGYSAFDELLEFLGEICEPDQTYFEIQFLEEEALPYRWVLTENKGWDKKHPRLVWGDE